MQQTRAEPLCFDACSALKSTLLLLLIKWERKVQGQELFCDFFAQLHISTTLQCTVLFWKWDMFTKNRVVKPSLHILWC